MERVILFVDANIRKAWMEPEIWNADTFLYFHGFLALKPFGDELDLCHFFFSFNLYLTRLLPLRSKISLTRDTWPRREQHWYTETHHTQLTTLKLTHIKHLHTDKLNCNDITRSLNIFTVRRAWSKVQIDMTVVLISQLHFSCVCNITMYEVFIYFIHYSYL